LCDTQRYEQLFKSNDPANGGSFYLQSKVYRYNAPPPLHTAHHSLIVAVACVCGVCRARERLEQEFKTNAEWQAKGGGTNAE
jgi:hypothetical protein